MKDVWVFEFNVILNYNHKVAQETANPCKNFAISEWYRIDGEKIHHFRLMVSFSLITIRCTEDSPS